MSKYSIECCEEMKNNSGIDAIIESTDYKPYKFNGGKKILPAAYIFDDESCSSYKINFCPFCGKKIEIIEN
jgi:hypothetical protein